MRISRTMLCAGLLLIAASLSFANPITYYLNQPVGAGSLTGYIETDGTTGVLSSLNILGWDLLLNDGSTTFALPDSRSFADVAGSDLSATPAQLVFDFSASDHGAVVFSDASFDFQTCFASYPQCIHGATGPGESLIIGANSPSAQFSSLSGPQVIAGMTLNTLPGGPPTAPILLPTTQPVIGFVGSIGGVGSQDYYEFYWSGGAFSATASIAGATNPGSSYQFAEGGFISSGCGSNSTATLNSADGFSGTITIANLPAGMYCVGIDANNPNDPLFAMTFNRPVEGAAPEPSTFALIAAGLVIVALTRLRLALLPHQARRLAPWSLIALCLIGARLNASPVTWYLQNATLGNGAIVTGSFTFDADAGSLSNLNIMSTQDGAVLPAETWNMSTIIPNAGYALPTAIQLANTNSYIVLLDFSSPLSDTGGAINLAIPGAVIYDIVTSGPTSYDYFQTGQTTSQVATLINYQGGAATAPALLPGGQPVAQIGGAIGGSGTQDYYTFQWTGGAFSATASLSGAASAASYLFSEGAAGDCAGLANTTLNSGDGFAGTLTIGNLAAGTYCIGINANSPIDPAFTLTFNTPVESTAPEPATSLFLSAGLVAILLRHSRMR
jgi:hypothetical protein